MDTISRPQVHDISYIFWRDMKKYIRLNILALEYFGEYTRLITSSGLF